MFIKIVTYTSLLMYLILFSGCANTQLKEQWRDPDYQRAASPQTVFVLAVTGRDQRRRVIEDQFVQKLRKDDINAVPSYPTLSVIGPTNIDAVKQAVQKSGATLVLMVRLVNIEQQTNVSGGTYYGPSGLYGYYPGAWSGIYDPPQIYTSKTYRTETRVFDVKGDKMIWAGTFDTSEPSDYNKAAADYAQLVVKQLEYNKILK